MFIKWKDHYINTIHIKYIKEINNKKIVITFIDKSGLPIEDTEDKIKTILDLIKTINYLPQYTEI